VISGTKVCRFGASRGLKVKFVSVVFIDVVDSREIGPKIDAISDHRQNLSVIR